MNLVFTKFPALSGGNDDDGAEVFLDGKLLARVSRELEHKDVGTTSVRYKATVTGYEVFVYADVAPELNVALKLDEYSNARFETLGEARELCRKLAKAGVKGIEKKGGAS